MHQSADTPSRWVGQHDAILLMPTLTAIAAFLDQRLGIDHGGDVPTVWRPATRPVARLVIALEPRHDLPLAEFDAVVLHRPFRITEDQWPGLGVLAVHGALDREWTTGWNPLLAARLGLTALQPLERAGAVVGMAGTLAEPVEWRCWVARLAQEFGGLDGYNQSAVSCIRRVVFANAFTAALAQDAVERGVDAYVTGQRRVPGDEAAERLGLATVYVGHRRSELWGLRQLARELAQAFPDLDVRLLDEE